MPPRPLKRRDVTNKEKQIKELLNNFTLEMINAVFTGLSKNKIKISVGRITNKYIKKISELYVNSE